MVDRMFREIAEERRAAKLEIIQEVRKVYDFMREPFGLIVADSLLVYNAYPVD